MFDEIAERPVALTLYTDAYVVHGTVSTRHHRVTDILNTAAEEFIVLSDVNMDEWGSTASPVRADYAQVNLAAVLFAVADDPVEPTPELRMAKIPEQAFITVPPFRVVGNIHLPPERNMRDALGELIGRFLPVTDATFWSDTVGEAKQSAVMVAINHSRAQILAPHTDVDPWAGLDRSAGLGQKAHPVAAATAATFAGSPGAIVGGSGAGAQTAGPAGEVPAPDARDPWGSPTATPAADPWGAPPAKDPWGIASTAAAPATPAPPAPPVTPAAPAPPAVPNVPTVPPSRTGLLGRVHGAGAALDFPRPLGDDAEGWRDEKD